MRLYISLFLCLVLCGGCATISGKDIERAHKAKQHEVEDSIRDMQKDDDFGEGSRVSVYDKNFVDLQVMGHEERLEENAEWIHRKISLNIQRPVAAKELMRMLRNKGINIASSLPLASYMYSGMGVHDTPINKALKVILGSMGLDYEIDYENRTISVVPMQWETYYVNLGNRSTSFQSGGGEADSFSTDDENSEDEESDIDTAQNEVEGESSYSISSKDKFWEFLEEEIKEKLTILVPVRKTRKQGEIISIAESIKEFKKGSKKDEETERRRSRRPDLDSDEESDLYEEVQIGRYSINPSTGAVHVQAPNWIQKEMGKYFKRISKQYDTQLRFEGRLFLVTEEDGKNRGVDWSLFEDIAGHMGIALENNALGGVTLHLPDPPQDPAGSIEIPGMDAPANGLFGVYDGDGPLRAFSAYLDQTTDITVIQKPTLTTTSGVPAKFQKFITRYYNSVSQTTTAYEGGTTVGTENRLVPVKLGTILTINPRYDVEKNLVRAQINLEENLLSGFQTTEQYLTAEEETESVSVDIPLVTQSAYSGEAVLEDGDLLIIGGQTDFQGNMTKSGSAFLKDTPMSALLSKKNYENSVSTYYFALHVSVEHN